MSHRRRKFTRTPAALGFDWFFPTHVIPTRTAQRSGEADITSINLLRLRRRIGLLHHDFQTSPGFLRRSGSFGFSVRIGSHGGHDRFCGAGPVMVAVSRGFLRRLGSFGILASQAVRRPETIDVGLGSGLRGNEASTMIL
ncbi:MAG: hypothetical protein ACREJ0_16820 [Geminicoccaceae bacterium]